MYTMAATIEVNPPDRDVDLTRELVWRGLVMKAENALPFVPAMQECIVTERFESGLVRSILARGERLTERVTFTPDVQVLFERTDPSGADVGWIANVLSEGEHGLLLTFVLNIVLPGVAPGSADERTRGAAIKQSYVEAIETTLRMMRTLAISGSLVPAAGVTG
jgi:hypothetical protein